MTSDDLSAIAVLAHLRERYGLPRAAAVTREVLSTLEGKQVLLVRMTDGADATRLLPAARPPLPWVVRLYPPWQRAERVEAQAHMLRLLEDVGYPAPRLVPAADGSRLTSLSDGEIARPVLVTTYVAGELTRLSLPGLRTHGETLGWLHALRLLPTVHPPADLHRQPVPAARMLPRPELAAAQAWLRDVSDRVPRALVTRYDALDAACRQLDRFEDVSRVLIHNDCHPWNSVRTAGGQVTLVDWEGAGLGPAVIDVGFVTLSTDTGSIVGPVLPPDPARLVALLGGYRGRHTLSPEELDRLADAIRFRTLVAACADFAGAVRRGDPGAERPWHWQRYLLAEQLADRARFLLSGRS